VEQLHAAGRLHAQPRSVRARTIVRGSYACFASQLPGSQAAFVSPIQYSYAYYNAVDRNEDGIAQFSKFSSTRVCRASPARTEEPVGGVNRVGADARPPVSHEFLGGFDKELTRTFR